MKNFSAHIGFYIQEIARKTTVRLNELLKELNISYAQFRVLNCLCKSGPLSQKKILKVIVVKPSTLSGTIDVLEKKQLVKREKDSNDGRINVINVTEEGKEVWKKAWEVVETLERETTQHIPKERKDELLKYLKTMNQWF